MPKKTLYLLQSWTRVFCPHFYYFPFNSSSNGIFTSKPFECIRNLSIFLFFDPLLNFFAFFLGGRRNFGRTLVILVTAYLVWFVLILYMCLIPRRYIAWKQCAILQHATKCEANTERFWFICHLLLSHWLLFLVFFHYFCAVFKHAGRVPLILPSNLPSVTICARCVRPRPIRAHHCVVCGECVLRMDHHCPWIANCVGLHSHRHFYLALCFMSVGGLYMLTVGRWEFQVHITEFERELSTSEKVNAGSKSITSWSHFGQSYYRRLHRVSSCCFIFGLIAIPLVMVLCMWQSILVSRGETSIEHHTNIRFTQQFERRGLIYHNPFDCGLLLNWIQFLNLFSPMEIHHPSSKINVHSLYFYSLLSWRMLSRILLPLAPSDIETGVTYRLNIPDAQTVLDSLSALDCE
ncbi:Palmitoyltransferase [Fasciola hepatica]|uniref:Palmitoyltransferase n=1 Tax=Fasciola hepatica TaxID=6192 RepID=A0A4E0QTP6_FASHE|nr:Palmitoyltransferase [Fasciola hepatica]